MTAAELKDLILFARRNRVKSISIDGASFELFTPGKKQPKAESNPEKPTVSIPKLPTLDQINDFIYTDPPEENAT